MQKKINVINSILLLLIIACSSLTIAVAQEATKEIRIKIEKDVNGEKHSIDRTFTDPDDPELKKLLEENNMNIGEGEIDIDINVDKDAENDEDNSATLKLKLKSDDEDQLNEFIDKIEQLAEDMDIDFSDIDIQKDDANQMFKLFGEDFEDITKKLKNKNFKLDTMIDLDAPHFDIFSDKIKNQLREFDINSIDPDGRIYQFFDFGETPSNKAIMGVMINDEEEGIVITGLNDGFGAKIAGLQEGDIIKTIDNKTVNSVDEVIDYINTLEPGDLVTVEYNRDGATETAKVELMESKSVRPRSFFKDEFHKKTAKPVMGVMIKDDGDKVKINGISDGFGAELAGLKEGDVIISVDNELISSAQELTDYINTLKVGDIIDVEYEREGKTETVEVQLMQRERKGDYPKYYNWIEKFNGEDIIGDKSFFDKDTRVMVMITDLNKEEEAEFNKVNPNNKLKTTDLELESFEFFPNPSEGIFNLGFEVDKRADIEVNIYSLSGKVVYNKTFENFKGDFDEAIDLQNNESGSYILEIIQGDKRTNKKLVIK